MEQQVTTVHCAPLRLNGKKTLLHFYFVCSGTIETHKMTLNMRKVMSFEIGDESMQDGYVRYTIRVDLRQVLAAILVALIVGIVFVFCFDHNKQISPDNVVYSSYHYDNPQASIGHTFALRHSPPSHQEVQLQQQQLSPSSKENENKRKFIKNMAVEAWNAYKQYAWGQNNLKPQSQSADYYGGGTTTDGGLRLIKSMSSLFIMGLKKEFEHGKEWIKTKFDLIHSFPCSSWDSRKSLNMEKNGLKQSLILPILTIMLMFLWLQPNIWDHCYRVMLLPRMICF